MDARSYHLRRPRFYTREQSKSADSLDARSLNDTAGEQQDFLPRMPRSSERTT